jgi:2-polyprenyl-3-methyl-5-hydroxy-6-metoxy-1,4-benzoquinol methylase
LKSPLTGKSDIELLKTLSPVTIAEQWRKSMGIELGERFGALSAIEYWHCKSTGLFWYHPPESAGEGELYSELENFDWYYTPDKWEFQKALALMDLKSRILEVGVGEGHFLRAAKDKGHEPVGVELNRKAAMRVKNQGFEVYELPLEELDKHVAEPFDEVCSFQVLEHVANPREFIEGMLRVLRPEGKLLLSVPDATFFRRIDPENKNILNQPPHHMSHWDEDVFRSLEDVMPVQVISVHHEPLASYHVGWAITGYFRGLLSRLDDRLLRILVNRYTTFPIKWLMLAGVRKWFSGHTLLVELVYRPR